MTPEPAGALPRGAAFPPSSSGERHLRLVGAHEHDWRLRDTEYVDGLSVRRLECDGCGGVDFS